jgi:hypothetical protein
VWYFRRDILGIFTCEGSAPGDFYQFLAIAGHPIAGVRTLTIFGFTLVG